ncbi:MAG: caspase family protein [Pseudomonadota bacterium]
MKGVAQKKFLCRFCLVFVIILVVCGISLPSLFAGQSRGVRIMAYDKASGKKKEVRLYNKSYAVVIGVDQYINLPFDKQLSYAVRDARGVAEILKKNFKFDKIITLYNREATKANIMKVLSGDLSKISEEDSVFVFWAGHGYTEKTSYGDLGYLLPFDGTFEDAELYKNISMTMIKDDISKRIPAKHIFYVMDSCYSGLLVAKRGASRKTARNFDYLKEITKEKVRQVLTAGSKDQEVLDGGPKGHSVFTGRLIDVLENTDDFITATELSTMVKEKVFSDAGARGHTQTPKHGELFGMGDYVFVPSLERKVEDTQAKLAGLQEELQRLKALEEAALKAKDEMAQRQAELEKKAVLAKLKAEQLKGERLAAEKKRRKQEEAERLRKEQELASKKKETELKLAALKRDVEAKRNAMGDSVLHALSLAATIKEMQEIDTKIEKIKQDYRKELANAINMVSKQVNEKFEKAVQAKKDEFESEAEFKNRVERMKTEAGQEQTRGFIETSKKIEHAYNKEVSPFIEALKKLSGQEFTLTAQDLILELHTYDAKSSTYPVTIKSKKPYGGVLIACNANIPIPKTEARIFKQHFENNILRPEISGNFQSTKFFRVARAYVIDDGTNKKYDLFASRFVDLGNGIVYDIVTKLLWLKDANYFKDEMTWVDARRACKNLFIADLSGWRLPNRSEIKRMFTVYHNEEPHPFKNLQREYHTSELVKKGRRWVGLLRERTITGHNAGGDHVWCVRGCE